MVVGDAARSYPAKAEERPASAESNFAAGRFNTCANRAYYACFQAAIAALTRAGIGPSARDGLWHHDAVQSQFVERLINCRKLYSANLRDKLRQASLLRISADCRSDPMTEIQAARELRRNREFVRAVLDSGRTSL